MNVSILFKILQRRNKYRNPNHYLQLPSDFIYSEAEYRSAREYLYGLASSGIKFTHPSHENYPEAFNRMKEPPLFLEYTGDEVWKKCPLLSVVGSREMEECSSAWINLQLSEFLQRAPASVGIVSGGARGVDQAAHRIALKCGFPTLFVLPSGLLNPYPPDLNRNFPQEIRSGACFLSEFEREQRPHKSHFYFRNRLISALGMMTLVVQSSLKSGSLLTVHHSLEFGKPVLTIPAHPEMRGFAGNIKLIKEGAIMVTDFSDLLDFWVAESWPN